MACITSLKMHTSDQEENQLVGFPDIKSENDCEYLTKINKKSTNSSTYKNWIVLLLTLLILSNFIGIYAIFNTLTNMIENLELENAKFRNKYESQQQQLDYILSELDLTSNDIIESQPGIVDVDFNTGENPDLLVNLLTQNSLVPTNNLRRLKREISENEMDVTQAQERRRNRHRNKKNRKKSGKGKGSEKNKKKNKRNKNKKQRTRENESPRFNGVHLTIDEDKIHNITHPDLKTELGGVINHWIMPGNRLNYFNYGQKVATFNQHNGTLTVRKEGLYFIYAQLSHYDRSGRWSFSIDVDRKSLAKCLAQEWGIEINKENGLYYHTIQQCYTGILAYLEEDQVVSIRAMYGDRTIHKHEDTSYWGMFMV